MNGSSTYLGAALRTAMDALHEFDLANVDEDESTYGLRLSLSLDAITPLRDLVCAVHGADWRVLGGVIPGPIPVEWVRVGDTIQDHGVKGTVSRIVRNGHMRHVYIDSGHVCFAKVAQQDFVHVTGNNHTDRTRPHETQDTASDEGWVEG